MKGKNIKSEMLVKMSELLIKLAQCSDYHTGTIREGMIVIDNFVTISIQCKMVMNHLFQLEIGWDIIVYNAPGVIRSINIGYYDEKIIDKINDYMKQCIAVIDESLKKQ